VHPNPQTPPQAKQKMINLPRISRMYTDSQNNLCESVQISVISGNKKYIR
jgi:hypothetical protein